MIDLKICVHCIDLRVVACTCVTQARKLPLKFLFAPTPPLLLMGAHLRSMHRRVHIPRFRPSFFLLSYHWHSQTPPSIVFIYYILHHSVPYFLFLPKLFLCIAKSCSPIQVTVLNGVPVFIGKGKLPWQACHKRATSVLICTLCTQVTRSWGSGTQVSYGILG